MIGKTRKNKEVLKELVELYSSKKGLIAHQYHECSHPEIVKWLIDNDFLQKEAFGMEHLSENTIYYLPSVYPLTEKGAKYLKLNWYEILQSSSLYHMIRDGAAFIALLLTLFLLISK
ncbi:MAG: hypothetical protein MJB14_00300 [Spirochaetes bacterium]|nr:hypothetical protein [Spirochaetota bacterium]